MDFDKQVRYWSQDKSHAKWMMLMWVTKAYRPRKDDFTWWNLFLQVHQYFFELCETTPNGRMWRYADEVQVDEGEEERQRAWEAPNAEEDPWDRAVDPRAEEWLPGWE